jgi:D-alanine-D-alanine ligase-like ATP-grasp enzyme/GNAT superfamily N-acetyltransferase
VDLSRVRRVVVVHNPVGEEDDPSISDVIAQAEMVERALAELGIPSTRLAVDAAGALGAFHEIAQTAGVVVFNLIEAPPGQPQLHPAAAGAIELAGLPFTGTSGAALWLTADKIATRALLASEGLPVAPGGRLDLDRPSILDRVPPPWILKPAFEDASIGLEGDPLCTTREQALDRAASLAHRFPHQPILLERYLPGRELNVSLLARGDDVEVLPIAEILFLDFPEGAPRIVGWEAKWDLASFAYTHTVPSFPTGPEDAALRAEAGRIAREAWRLCGLAGYARVDFRLDEHGRPHVLEINANPCISPEAGFLTAAAQAGMSPRNVVERILAASLHAHAMRGVEASPPGPLSHRPPNPRERGNDSSPACQIRRDLSPADRSSLEALIRGTGFFNPEEIDIALELIDDRLSGGDHYRFLVAEADGAVAGYACWGPIPGTAASADLYWIAVDRAAQGRGVGAALMKEAESWMASEGRTLVWVETSTRSQYEPTRRFYLACGYDLAARLPGYYAPGDGKAIFRKDLA